MGHKFFRYLIKNQVVFALFLVALGLFIFEIRGIITSLFLSYILMAALLPLTNFLQKKKVPKVFSVLIPYTGMFILLFVIVLPLIPFMVGQIKSLFTSLPSYIHRSADIFGISIDPKNLQDYLSREADNIGRNALTVTSRVFETFFRTIAIFIISFYLLYYHDSFAKSVANLFEKDKRDHIALTIDHIDDKLGAWLTGQVILSFAIGVLTWIALTVIGLVYSLPGGFPYALPLALLAGILEIIPTLGPILSAIPAVIVGFTISPGLALVIVLVYIFIQFSENHILVPKIMQKAVGLNPVVVIVAIMIGSNLMGIAGAFLSIPFVSFIIVLFHAFNKVFVKSNNHTSS